MVNTVSFVRLADSEASRVRVALLFGAVLSLLVLKAACIGTERLVDIVLSATFDGLALVLVWLCSELIAGRSQGARQTLSWLFFAPVLYGLAGLMFAHAWFFDAAVERRLTLFDVTFAGIAEFFNSALPRSGYWALAGLLVGMHLIALLAYGVGLKPRKSAVLVGLVPLTAACAVASSYAARTPSVLFDTAADLHALLTLPRLKGKQTARVTRWVGALDKSPTEAPQELHFSKVVVLVMETMTLDKLRAESASLPPSTFFHSGQPHTHRYTRYFPNNQDSRTGMLNMLFSRVIPYEAYSERDVERYRGLSDLPSLVDTMKGLGFRSAFAVSQEALEEVVAALSWDQTLNLSKDEIAHAKQKELLCLAPDEWENGCEDLAVLPKVLRFLEQNERAFVYQEFIWGHDSTYNELSGKSNSAYYSQYVDALLAGLSEKKLSEETLVVLTSDHGFRDKSKQAELWVYQIPLWFYAPRFQESARQQLLSHVDFKELLLAELSGAPVSSRNELVMIVGPTGSGMVSAIAEDGTFALFKRRLGRDLLLSWEKGSAQAPSGDELLSTFQSYRSAFDARMSGATKH